MSVDLPEPDGPMIAANWPAGKPTVTPRERVDGGLALAVDAAELGGADDRRRGGVAHARQDVCRPRRQRADGTVMSGCG